MAAVGNATTPSAHPTQPASSQPAQILQALLDDPVKFVRSKHRALLINGLKSPFDELLNYSLSTAKYHSPRSITSSSDTSCSSSPEYEGAVSVISVISTAATSPPSSKANSENGTIVLEAQPHSSQQDKIFTPEKTNAEEAVDFGFGNCTSAQPQAEVECKNGATSPIINSPFKCVSSSVTDNCEDLKPSFGANKEHSNTGVKPDKSYPRKHKAEEPCDEEWSLKHRTPPAPAIQDAATEPKKPSPKKRKAENPLIDEERPHKSPKLDPIVSSPSPPNPIPDISRLRKEKGRRVKGLRNPHIMCYRNAVLQLLASSRKFREEAARHREKCSVGSACVTCGLANFFEFHYVNPGEKHSLNSNIRLIAALKKVLPEPFCRIMGQEDAYEYLAALLSTAETQITKNLGGKEKNNNPIYQAFSGCYPSVVQCQKCKFMSSNNMESTSLILDSLAPRSSDEEILLKDKIMEYLKGERVEWKCEKCKGIQAIKMNTISRAPEFLIINIARHRGGRFAWKYNGKVLNQVTFEEKITLPITSNERKEANYILQSVVVHRGESMCSGHYYAYIRQPDGTWARCNDEMVTPVNPRTVSSCANGHAQACLLGYRKL